MLPDVLAEALAKVVAEKQKEWELMHRVAMAELEKRSLERDAEFAERFAVLSAKVEQLRGPRGEAGKPGERVEVAR